MGPLSRADVDPKASSIFQYPSRPWARFAVQTPRLQVSPRAQEAPQAPQFAASVFLLISQPSVWLWLQSRYPALQEVKKQPPPEQPAEPCGKVQVWPQVPQLLGSNDVLVHMPVQAISFIEQVAVQTPLMQASPAAQAFPQVPQLALSVMVLAQ